MGKRKASDKTPSKDTMDVDDDDSGSDGEIDTLDVDFEWFDPQPAVDFHGLKTLLRQLFDVDNQLFDLSELTDLILAQPLLGSTVKCEGNESDPFAFLTVLNLHQHRAKPVIQQLTSYLLRITQPPPPPQQHPNPALAILHSHLQKLLSPDSSSTQLGLILTERFINMPHQIVPPMYNMLLEEMQWALDAKEPYDFTHYLVISRTYTQVASKLDVQGEDDPPAKKSKQDGSASSSTSAAAAAVAAAAELSYFHPEDEVLQKHAKAFAGFEFEKQGDEGASDAKRAFSELGVKPHGHLILLEGKRFAGAVKAVGEYLSGE